MHSNLKEELMEINDDTQEMNSFTFIMQKKTKSIFVKFDKYVFKLSIETKL